ncbi:MAG: hypothetical protein WC505_05515 [Patescibacteria group bacterium]
MHTHMERGEMPFEHNPDGGIERQIEAEEARLEELTRLRNEIEAAEPEDA